MNSNNDENEPSPVTGWEVALFTEQNSSDQNMVAVAENKEVGLQNKQDDEVDMLKLEGLYNEANVGVQNDGGYQIGQVNSNPFDFQTIHDPTQYNMALDVPQNVFCVPPNIPPQFLSMQPYQVCNNNAQQQQEEPFTMIKKSTNPFDEPNILPSPPQPSTSVVPQHLA